MRYTMKAGILFLHEQMLMRIRNILAGSERRIETPDGQIFLKTQVCWLEAPAGRRGDVRFHRYLLLDPQGNEIARAEPAYAPGQEPEKAGWPVCRTPLADHANLQIGDSKYRLDMKSCQEYLLKNPAGKAVIRILHRGVAGGWAIEAEDSISPGLLCAVFIFCRYLEQENEFVVV